MKEGRLDFSPACGLYFAFQARNIQSTRSLISIGKLGQPHRQELLAARVERHARVPDNFLKGGRKLDANFHGDIERRRHLREKFFKRSSAASKQDIIR